MRIPRWNTAARLALAAGLVALIGPEAARAGDAAGKPCPVEEVYEYDEPAPVPPELVQDIARRVQVMLTLVAGPPQNYRQRSPTKRVAPPGIGVAIVVQAPFRQADFAQPAFDAPTFPSDNPSVTPEPASLVTGLIGGGLALASWARRRKRPGAAEV